VLPVTLALFHADTPMARPHPAPRRTHRTTLLAALAALAVLLRLLLPPMPMPAAAAPEDALTLLLSGGGICHADPAGPASTDPGVACPLCPLCAGPAAVLLPAPPPLPARSAIAAPIRLRLPPATAPPATGFAIAQPRGPPALSA
jgi:hypothetical protein